MAFKVKVENLGELRNELRFTQDELADAMAIVRQSVAGLEKGQTFDYRFVQDAFTRLKTRVGADFWRLELIEVADDRETLRVSFSRNPPPETHDKPAANSNSPLSISLEIDRDAHLILLLTAWVKASGSGKDEFVGKHYDLLASLQDAIAEKVG